MLHHAQNGIFIPPSHERPTTRTPPELQQLLSAEARRQDAIVTATGIRID